MSTCEISWSALIALIGVLAVIGGGTVGYAIGYERARAAIAKATEAQQ